MATLVVLDLTTGEEVVRSAADMGDPAEDDLAVAYEDAEVDVAALTGTAVYVDTLTGTLVHDLRSGDVEPLPEGEEPPGMGTDPLVSPDGRWSVRDRGLADVLVATGGRTVTPRAGTPRRTFYFWADDTTVVGTAVDGPGTGPRVTPADSTALMTCTVPSGDCDVLDESVGELVVYPLATGPVPAVQLQEGDTR